MWHIHYVIKLEAGIDHVLILPRICFIHASITKCPYYSSKHRMIFSCSLSPKVHNNEKGYRLQNPQSITPK